MAKIKSNIELKRVNINLPTDLVERVRKYADSLGVNTTSAYIYLLNQALDQKEQINALPVLVGMYNQVMSNPKLMELAQSSNDNEVN